jgi:hypothetical protein
MKVVSAFATGFGEEIVVQFVRNTHPPHYNEIELLY